MPEPIAPSTVRCVVLDDVGSTNSEAFARAAAGEPGPLWVMARRQTLGRGRAGRAWTSDPGNLYASLLQRSHCPLALVYQVSLIAGIAVVDAVRGAAGERQIAGLRLKWPNDALIDGAKCAGILAESQTAQTGEVVLVIGIGINLSSHPGDIGRAATHLAAHDIQITPEAMLGHLAGTLGAWLEVWDEGRGFARIRAAWLDRAGPIGEPVTVNAGSQRIGGAFAGLDETGALLVREASGAERRVTFGDVALGANPGSTG
ncbi:MAG: biotin--[acetyl-CoA-carboxylase] ligase [Hyphomicrobiaceae bacterium]|nr:biotin--[acetyl-CoA-carboxylase] ligase [Hyphomicrobiaceae bacterium]